MSFRVLVTSQPMLSTLEACQKRFTAENFKVVAPQITRQYTETELCDMIADFDGVIAGGLARLALWSDCLNSGTGGQASSPLSYRGYCLCPLSV